MDSTQSHQRVFLVIGKHWPEPTSSAAGVRLMQLLTPLVQHNRVVFASAAVETTHSAILSDLGIDSVPIQLNDASFDDFVKALDPEFVLFDRFMTEEQFGWRVRKQCPKAIRILDTEDLHGLRMAREIAHKAHRKVIDADFLNDVALRELAAIYRCDQTLIISSYEMELLQDRYGMLKELLFYIPLLGSHVGEEQDLPGFEQRDGFVTIGNVLHAPNRDSVAYLREEIWPLIRKQIPYASLRIYGAYMPQELMKWSDSANGFFVEGRTENVDFVMRSARACLAPLRFGAGMKGKLLAAMENQTPSVTTSIGAEGMGVEKEWPGCIADDPSEFAKGAIALYNDQTKWVEAASKAKALLTRNFHPEFWTPQWLESLKSLRQSYQERRLKNATSAVLWHQSLRSTEYFARWIEAKSDLQNGA